MSPGGLAHADEVRSCVRQDLEVAGVVALAVLSTVAEVPDDRCQDHATERHAEVDLVAGLPVPEVPVQGDLDHVDDVHEERDDHDHCDLGEQRLTAEGRPAALDLSDRMAVLDHVAGLLRHFDEDSPDVLGAADDDHGEQVEQHVHETAQCRHDFLLGAGAL